MIRKNTIRKTIPIKEKQILFLHHNWELINILKETRNKIAILSTTMLLGITGYVLSKDGFLDNPVRLVAATLIIIILSAISIILINTFADQYSYRFRLIIHLYHKLGITGDNFRPQEPENLDAGAKINKWVIIMMYLIGFVCMIAIVMGSLFKK